MNTNVLRILIADDHEVARRGIRALLEAHPGWEVTAEARDGREAVELANKIKPDLVLLDIGMPNLNGLDAARQILSADPDTKILILTMHDTEQVVREVLSAGARGFLLKSDAGRDIICVLVEQMRQFLKVIPCSQVYGKSPRYRPMILEESPEACNSIPGRRITEGLYEEARFFGSERGKRGEDE